ncbi:MAG: betaine--homocysteine S-methyltransferase [Myxococcota bacterium]|nr:betaine--homocysteine S-methyltransferase [Myxococcota bacterium]
MSDLLSELLAERDYLVADGATGTNLMRMGLPPGQAPDLWNLDQPENVTRNYESFIEVGADIILTNTFGANRCRLSLEQAQGRTSEINEAGARLACAAREKAGRPLVVAGSMGPTGEIMVPHGEMTSEEAEDVFSQQAEALVRGGVDVLWIETVYAFEELAAAVAAAAKTGLPVVSTMTFDTAGHTMMGDSPEDAARFVHTLPTPLVAYGANCGVGPATLVDAIRGFGRGGQPGDVLIAKGNCGVPEMIDGEVVFKGDVDIMARYARLARDAGARIIGGCCGTAPEHLEAVIQSLDGYEPGPSPDDAQIEEALGTIDRSAGKKKKKARSRRRK